jgi:hypothetical protein
MMERELPVSEERDTHNERRRSPRARISCEFLLRSADHGFRQFEEVVTTLNISRHGFYFQSPSSSFHKARKLVVIMRNESSSKAEEPEFPAEVVRVDWRADGNYGIAVQFMHLTSLME